MMKKLFLALIGLALIIAGSVWAFDPPEDKLPDGTMLAGVIIQSVAAEAGTSYLFEEDFDGAEACGDGSHSNCDNTWTVGGFESSDFNDTTIADGTYNLFLSEEGSSPQNCIIEPGSGDWYNLMSGSMYFMWRMSAEPGNNAQAFGTGTWYAYYRPTLNKLQFEHGTSDFTIGVSTGTTYHIWIDWVSDGSDSVDDSDGTLEVTICTNADKVTGCSSDSLSDGEDDDAWTYINLRAEEFGTGEGFYFDKVRGDDSTIGGNPE